jgi:hypothetical protein
MKSMFYVMLRFSFHEGLMLKRTELVRAPHKGKFMFVEQNDKLYRLTNHTSSILFSSFGHTDEYTRVARYLLWKWS